jgi:predicted nucleic acid-binding protein
MILVDTSLVVDYLRSPTPRLIQTIKDHEAAICGVTLAEIYAAARMPNHFKKYDLALSVFGHAAIPKRIWPKLGRNLALLGSKGVTVPFPDALIATIALENDLELWQHDHHFPTIQKAIPQLKLFQEP